MRNIKNIHGKVRVIKGLTFNNIKFHPSSCVHKDMNFV